jgi:hypothetical protein
MPMSRKDVVLVPSRVRSIHGPTIKPVTNGHPKMTIPAILILYFLARCAFDCFCTGNFRAVLRCDSSSSSLMGTNLKNMCSLVVFVVQIFVASSDTTNLSRAVSVRHS